ncbi:hypothetical protein CCACVL1_07115 [Corchorus capsularis]|uniref:Uncharacterized protein n=1 Tax=Corchorus capsularis TaxID=210143 RepID=A0A1R3J9D3_COCAP|nr:hypothetical protein CCACVL1_07115 [Corchorus capsularis]
MELRVGTKASLVQVKSVVKRVRGQLEF